MDDPLLISQADADSIFVELGTLCVHLDDDPLAFGPKRLNRKVAEVRRMLDRCERIFLDVSQRLYATRRALRSITTEIDLAKKNLLANDPETMAGRSVADRDAIATGKLSKNTRRMHELESSSLDLEQVLTVVKSKRADLKDAEGRLKDQVRLCQEELGLGHHWGSMAHPGETTVSLHTAHPVPNDALEIATIIASVDGEVHLAREMGSWVDPDISLPVEEPLLPEEKEEEPLPLPKSKLQAPLDSWEDKPAGTKIPEALLHRSVESFPPTGKLCSLCRLPQYLTPSGETCTTPGHGGVPALEETEKEELLPDAPSRPAEEALPGTVSSEMADEFLNLFTFNDPVQKVQEKRAGPNPKHLADPDFLSTLLADFESNE